MPTRSLPTSDALTSEIRIAEAKVGADGEWLGSRVQRLGCGELKAAEHAHSLVENVRSPGFQPFQRALSSASSHLDQRKSARASEVISLSSDSVDPTYKNSSPSHFIVCALQATVGYLQKSIIGDWGGTVKQSRMTYGCSRRMRGVEMDPQGRELD